MIILLTSVNPSNLNSSLELALNHQPSWDLISLSLFDREPGAGVRQTADGETGTGVGRAADGGSEAGIGRAADGEPGAGVSWAADGG